MHVNALLTFSMHKLLRLICANCNGVRELASADHVGQRVLLQMTMLMLHLPRFPQEQNHDSRHSPGTLVRHP